MGIPIGKMALYTALAGIPPGALPAHLLDVGTDNQDGSTNHLHRVAAPRLRGAEYDSLVDEFVQRCDRAGRRASCSGRISKRQRRTLLDRYRERSPPSTTTSRARPPSPPATLLAAVQVTGISLRGAEHCRGRVRLGGYRHHELLRAPCRRRASSEEEARRRFYAIDRHGLLTEAR